MNKLLKSLFVLAIAGTCHITQAEEPPAGYVDFGNLVALGGGDSVDVNLNSNLISMAARIAAHQEPEVAKILRGLTAIRVNVVQVKEEHRERILQGLTAIRSQLDTKGWERVVSVNQSTENVAIHLKTRTEEAVEGIAITVFDGSQAVLVNFIGDIRPEQVAKVGQRFGIPPLKELEKALGNRTTEKQPEAN